MSKTQTNNMPIQLLTLHKSTVLFVVPSSKHTGSYYYRNLTGSHRVEFSKKKKNPNVHEKVHKKV